MRREDLVAFARRDWGSIETLKRRRWAQQKSQMTAAEALRVGDDLRLHARSLSESWPTDEDRRNDLLVHLRVSESLRRAQSPRRR